MEEIGVWSGETRLAELLRRALGQRYRFLPGSHGAHFAGRGLGLLIVSPTAAGLGGAGVVNARLALIPGGNLALAHSVRAASAVSYGLGRQNTLTLSSLDGERLSVALQRELITLSGSTLERQEWVLPYDGQAETVEMFLCRVGAMLLLDERPE